MVDGLSWTGNYGSGLDREVFEERLKPGELLGREFRQEVVAGARVVVHHVSSVRNVRPHAGSGQGVSVGLILRLPRPVASFHTSS
jgi:hypothetical protein